MAKSIGEAVRAQDLESASLSELIHQQVRIAIETAVHEELRAALAASPWQGMQARRGYRNGTGVRTLPALQSRCERADQVAKDRRLAEDRLDAQPAYGRGGVMIVCIDSEPCKRL
jgi:hypothetical protein